jgi:hypothetical protein
MSRIESVRTKAARWVLGFVVLCAIAIAALVPKGAGAVLNPPPGGPILVITSPTSTFGSFYGEILRNEGLNEFAMADIGSVNATTLAPYDVVVLAKATLTPAQVTMFTNWVNGGGNLIAMAPDAQLAPLLGLSATGTALSEGYLLVNTATSPGAGLVGQTMQYHGSADRYTLSGATIVATLYSNATTATANPAVTTRGAGTGSASAFTYDLATSVVYTRQGNPAWATQERDGLAPIRSDDKYFGNASGDPRPDWIDLSKVAIPQADEQQRLLANLILHVNQAKKPLPRFWYFPYGKKAAVVMTGDDHANGGTAGRFEQLLAESAPGCSVADWECLRGTSYLYTSSPLTDAQASTYHAAGFEVGVHINTDCANYTPTSLQATYVAQIAEWQAKYASVPAPATQRHHCIVWSDWTSGADVQLVNGMRLDTSYYFWPPGWVGNVPGLFTGSAMPMRFSSLSGNLIDVYQAATQMTDESGQTYPFTIDTLLDRAVGAEGYYGAYTVNAHTDISIIPESTAVIASAKARGVPVVSSRQMLTWLDGRNSSSFGSFTWNGLGLHDFRGRQHQWHSGDATGALGQLALERDLARRQLCHLQRADNQGHRLRVFLRYWWRVYGNLRHRHDCANGDSDVAGSWRLSRFHWRNRHGHFQRGHERDHDQRQHFRAAQCGQCAGVGFRGMGLGHAHGAVHANDYAVRVNHLHREHQGWSGLAAR